MWIFVKLTCVLWSDESSLFQKCKKKWGHYLCSRYKACGKYADSETEVGVRTMHLMHDVACKLCA